MGFWIDHLAMVIDINESNLETIEQIREFLAGTSEVAFSIPADESKRRAFVATVIRRLRYFSLTKGQRDFRRCSLCPFDRGLDLPPLQPARQRALSQAAHGLVGYSTLAGKRQAPAAPQGLPGYIRIDSVHQGDQDGMKGVYHINAVDIVTEWELVASVERISEAYLLPVIALLLDGLPFEIRGFHSDSGSEHVNHESPDFWRSCASNSPSRALAKPTITRWPNARTVRSSARSWDTATSRKNMPLAINRFYTEVFNLYLNFHRPCYFAVD